MNDTSDGRAIELMIMAEEVLTNLQRKDASRKRAIVLTNLQTAILWGQKEIISGVFNYTQKASDTESDTESQ